jgi:undecaprenyl diphosphate synthase
VSDLINQHNIPQHIAVIMDGNGRWAKQKGAARIFGHNHAVKSVRETVEGCAELGVKYLTLYAFSTENWTRPQAEVNALMALLVSTISGEVKTLNKNSIRLQAIGDLKSLPSSCQKELDNAIEATSQNTRMTLVLALSYSSRWEIINAVKAIASDIEKGILKSSAIEEKIFEKYLCTADMPDPDLLIRTSGEMRISNFLLWQIAYTEIYITDTLWPDFRKEHLHEAIANYQKRERRFGKISEQLAS